VVNNSLVACAIDHLEERCTVDYKIPEGCFSSLQQVKAMLISKHNKSEHIDKLNVT